MIRQKYEKIKREVLEIRAAKGRGLPVIVVEINGCIEYNGDKFKNLDEVRAKYGMGKEEEIKVIRFVYV